MQYRGIPPRYLHLRELISWPSRTLAHDYLIPSYLLLLLQVIVALEYVESSVSSGVLRSRRGQ